MQDRLTPQVHKHQPTQPTPEASCGDLESTFVLCISSRSKLMCPLNAACSDIGLDPVSFAQEPMDGTNPHACVHKPATTPGFSLSEGVLHIDQGEISTDSLGKFLWDGDPTALAWPQQHFWAAVMPKLYRKCALRGAKMVQDTLRSLKAIWHFVKLNQVPHILPMFSKLHCPTNLAILPCLPFQNRISFWREMQPRKIFIFLASNYGNIFHLLCLSVRTFSFSFGITFKGCSVLPPALLQKDFLAKEFPKLSFWKISILQEN